MFIDGQELIVVVRRMAGAMLEDVRSMRYHAAEINRAVDDSRRAVRESRVILDGDLLEPSTVKMARYQR